ncbi:hypothetical protein RS3R6_08380 [Pseudomonas atacamensis]|uniref:Uncharacterized protein n=1 Tax=Pseudomonas atacamensis TaxID=2565368 RepID=A0ABQ5PMC2_9PSED|nr:hypothetical protein RS3R1_37710 [Pseudomonas atacamensis]GLH52657.1 hypothetical protein RS3R6_08380 [Pseudomonas atacamensis]
MVQKVEIGRLGDRHRELAHFYKERGVHQEESGRLSGRLREQARSHKSKKQSSAAARGEAAPLNNERKLEYRF